MKVSTKKSSYIPSSFRYRKEERINSNTQKRKNIDVFDIEEAQIEKDYKKIRKKEKLPKHELIENIAISSIRKIRFSQLYVDGKIRTGETLEELKEKIQNTGWDTRYPLHVVAMPDLEFTSLDNRRLYALKEIAEENPAQDIPNVNAILDFFEDPADKLTFNGVFTRIKDSHPSILETIDSEAKKLGIPKNSYGYCVLGRMQGITPNESTYYQLTKPQSDSPYGFDSKPIIKTNRLRQQFLQQSFNRV
ncbi:MAG: hypothetical protein Tsb0015_05990 [Simkaniaceae bacterium]